jgi:glycosyltransferase involved in cell wall biosynthesis
MIEHFPTIDSGWQIRKIVSSYFSNGILWRVRGMIEARRNAGDVTHVVGDVHYLTLALAGRSTVLTIHDCGFLSHPNPAARRVLKTLWLDLPVAHCAAVTAVSEATKREIVRATGCDPDKVTVIPTLIGGQFHRADKPFSSRSPQVLHIGLAPNKNFFNHVAALAGLNCRLRIIGKLERHHSAALEASGIDYRADYNLSDAEMQEAYASSDVLLFASTLEGFGMPILEAQTVGRPVITSNLSSMPEVAGSAACLVDPSSTASIRAGLQRVIGDPSFREAIVERGFDNVKRYSARTVAAQYAELYRLVASSARADQRRPGIASRRFGS